ncbi:hypothetical protein N431DRAFT_454451 [Stipitochalara longipes BDJ]|nr:hypothetical protein N431DRAFT_454451 [Stipitochalara longipes BDJ]
MPRNRWIDLNNMVKLRSPYNQIRKPPRYLNLRNHQVYTLTPPTPPRIRSPSPKPQTPTTVNALLIPLNLPYTGPWSLTIDISSIPTKPGVVQTGLRHTFTNCHGRPRRGWVVESVKIRSKDLTVPMNLLNIPTEARDNAFKMVEKRGWKDEVVIKYRAG